MDYHKALIWVLMLFIGWQVNGQTTTVEGVVYEDSTSNAVTYAKVFFMGSQIGAYTDTSGHFKISIRDNHLKHDSVVVSFLGYISQTIPIQRGVENKLEIYLQSSLFVELEEVTAKAGENPAWHYMRLLLEAKERNNPDNLSYHSSHEYSKIRFDLNHFTDKIKKNLLLKPFDYIWDNTQVTDDGVNYLPMLITEKLSEHYYRKSPTDRKDVVTAEKTTGLAGPNLVKFTEDLYLTPNIYDNYISILGKSFPSPLNDNYKSNYRFYLMDSTRNENGKTYKIRFLPKHKRELAFSGEMYFDSASYAIKEVNLRFDVMANVNFVRSYYITQKYAPVNGDHWMLRESQVIGDFTVFENSSDLTGFFGRKKATYSNYTIEEPIDDKIFRGIEVLVQADSAEAMDDAFWEKYRPEELSQEEKVLYADTKKVLDDPAFKFRKNFLLTIATGYIPFKPLQLGLYSMYSYNFIEKSRVKLDLRTDPNWDLPFNFSGYLAYGTFDQQWKYRVASDVLLSKKSNTRIGASYMYDLQELGRSFNQITIDHLLSSLVQIGNTSARNYVTEFEGYIDQQITTGSLLRVGYFNRRFNPVSDSSYLRIDPTTNTLSTMDNIQTAGLTATFKFSYLYDDLKGSFYDRKDFYKEFRKYPDVAISYTYADNALFASDFDYQKLKISVRQKVDAKKLGYFQYTVETGKTFGTVPYPLLDIPYGNQLVLADAYSFNLMRFMEQASDEYVTIHLAHHFNGLLMDRIPLINKLKWRSFIFGKSYLGRISAANNGQVFLFPENLTGISEPYYEIGFGFENIFKIARMDFVWRLSPGQGEYYTFLVKPSFKIGF